MVGHLTLTQAIEVRALVPQPISAINKGMKALCLVAHPDDCIIFAYPFIHHHPDYEWTICYLTYDELSGRGKEMLRFWNKRNVDVKFLQFEDNCNDRDTNEISFSTDDAKEVIISLVQDYDVVLTHNQHGDYGHIHHKFIYDCLDDHSNVITFADTNNCDIVYDLPVGTYTLSEIPIHAKAISKFHIIFHSCGYNLPK